MSDTEVEIGLNICSNASEFELHECSLIEIMDDQVEQQERECFGWSIVLANFTRSQVAFGGTSHADELKQKNV